MNGKAQVRRPIRAARARLGEQELAERGERLALTLQRLIPAGAPLTGYVPLGGEPEVRPALDWHLRAGGRVMLPVVKDAVERQMVWSRWVPGAPLVAGAIPEILEPGGDRITTAELAAAGPLWMLVPALALDITGARLGQGGGFYDTALGSLPNELRSRVTLIGVVHPEEVLEAGSFPVEKHDLRMDWVATHEELLKPV